MYLQLKMFLPTVSCRCTFQTWFVTLIVLHLWLLLYVDLDRWIWSLITCVTLCWFHICYSHCDWRLEWCNESLKCVCRLACGWTHPLLISAPVGISLPTKAHLITHYQNPTMLSKHPCVCVKATDWRQSHQPYFLYNNLHLLQ